MNDTGDPVRVSSQIDEINILNFITYIYICLKLINRKNNHDNNYKRKKLTYIS